MYRVIEQSPTLEEYLALRRLSGLSPKTSEQGERALVGSWFFCHVRDEDDRAVAMGRVIGDGGWYFHIADMATLPEFQRQGLGRMVLERLLSRVKAEAPAHPYVNLIADSAGQPLYTSLGFTDAAPGLGMQLRL